MDIHPALGSPCFEYAPLSRCGQGCKRVAGHTCTCIYESGVLLLSTATWRLLGTPPSMKIMLQCIYYNGGTGAIWASASSLVFNGTNTFTGNSARYGGAIYARTYLGNLVILLAVKCVLGAHFRASSLHIPATCKLSSSFNDFRSKSTRYRTLASRLGSTFKCIKFKFVSAAPMLSKNLGSLETTT